MERKFFSENSGFISDFLQNLREGKNGYDDKRLKKIEAIETFLIVAMQHSDQYGKWARLSLSWMGGEIKRIFSDSRVDGESIDRLFEIISRLSREITIRTAHFPNEPREQKEARQFFLDYYLNDDINLTAKEKENRDFLTAMMPEYMIRHYLYELAQQEEKIKNISSRCESDLKRWDSDIKKHEENLRKYSQQYNFVRLSKAFDEMYRRKVKEGWAALSMMLFFGGVAAIPLAYQVLTGELGFMAKIFMDGFSVASLGKALPLLLLEGLLVYFFRVTLHNWYSIRAQALQLDLRKSLCAFIEEYMDFVKNNQRQDGSSLGRFESLIFSGIVSEPGQLPTVFDGLESMAKTIAGLRREER